MVYDEALNRLLRKVPNPHPKLVDVVITHPNPEAKLKELLSKANLGETLKRNRAWLKAFPAKPGKPLTERDKIEGEALELLFKKVKSDVHPALMVHVMDHSDPKAAVQTLLAHPRELYKINRTLGSSKQNMRFGRLSVPTNRKVLSRLRSLTALEKQ
ncbi:MAG TPA: hypothetical protein VGQ00_01225 [Candidatus Norongarragalinales archaeon]|nr:hypothetical protein [Candidatus Norongarragalinales archaeon]